MVSLARPLTFAVHSVGPVARRCLSNPTRGRVAAVFAAAFYIEIGSQLICVGTAALEPGPLNLNTLAPAGLDWRASGIRSNDAVIISASEIRVAKQFRFTLLRAIAWSPEPVAEAIDPAAAVIGLAAFRKTFCSQLTEDGIGRFIDPDYHPEKLDGECRAAKVPIIEARCWLVRAFRRKRTALSADRRWIGKLTGLGVGLTPSGDDFLGGVMIALHSLGNNEIGRVLWSSIRPCAEESTNTISLAHLRAASEGLGSASIHRSVSGILRGDIAAIHDSAPGLDRMGHASGWDAMTGAAVALDSWLKSQKRNAA